MDKKLIIDRLLSKKGKDYTYTIAFFLIFSFFTFFIIRPNILAIFQANLKIQDLKKTNFFYEDQIQKMINAQSALVEARDNLDLLDEAITTKPQINGLIRDFTDTVNKNNLGVDKISLVDINLKDITQSDQLKIIVMNSGLTGNFEDCIHLIKALYGQRRLKLLKNIDISKGLEGSTSSANLQITFQMEGYYL